MPAAALAQAEPDPREKATWHFKAAKAAFLAKKYDKAINELKTVMELDPQPVVMYNMARVLEEKGERAAAVEWYLKALQSGLSGELGAGATARVQVLSKIVETSAAESKKMATISVEIEEPQAWVYVDGEVVGQGSLREFGVKPGKHTFGVVHPSYEEWGKEREVRAGERIVLDVQLVRLEKVGKLTVESPVSGATLVVDGQPVGVLPVADLPLKPGKHRLHVSAEGYVPYVTEVELKEQQTALINAALKETDKSGRLLVETPVTGARVWVDGKEIGLTPVKRVELRPGLHNVVIEADGFRKFKADVNIPPTQFVLLPAQLQRLEEGDSFTDYPDDRPRKRRSQADYDSFVSAFLGWESIPAMVEHDNPDNNQHFTRDNLLMGVAYVPNGLGAGGVFGINFDMRFFGAYRVPVSIDPKGTLAPHNAAGGGGAFFLNIAIKQMVGIYGSAGAQYYYNFATAKKRDHMLLPEKHHEMAFPFGGGVSVRVWKMIVVNPEFYYVLGAPEIIGQDLEPALAKRSSYVFKLGVGFAYDGFGD